MKVCPLHPTKMGKFLTLGKNKSLSPPPKKKREERKGKFTNFEMARNAMDVSVGHKQSESKSKSHR